ncbi:MAG: cyclic pyranopterin monophosphate synthase MoaC [Deltaproteobacteria bacterium]|nr:cyclic pyranopterin monophosphate synthase MoaC [Deltaproteobacteria bacterium]
MSNKLTHLTEDGSPHIVNITRKSNTYRVAQAQGWIEISKETLDVIEKGDVHKGDVLSIAKLAGICGSKKTSEVIPLCHPIPIDSVSVSLQIKRPRGVHIIAEVCNEWKTGVEMEAMMAVTSAALTVYDMVKGIQKDAKITDISLAYKEGGKSGIFGEKIIQIK